MILVSQAPFHPSRVFTAKDGSEYATAFTTPYHGYGRSAVDGGNPKTVAESAKWERGMCERVVQYAKHPPMNIVFQVLW
jgi:hypothetical protein